MPNRRKILIVDDGPELRDALTEQLSLHQEFEAVAAENGSKGVQAAKAAQIEGGRVTRTGKQHGVSAWRLPPEGCLFA